jgi:hypothetical protein
MNQNSGRNQAVSQIAELNIFVRKLKSGTLIVSVNDTDRPLETNFDENVISRIHYDS